MIDCTFLQLVTLCVSCFSFGFATCGLLQIILFYMKK